MEKKTHKTVDFFLPISCQLLSGENHRWSEERDSIFVMQIYAHNFEYVWDEDANNLGVKNFTQN